MDFKSSKEMIGLSVDMPLFLDSSRILNSPRRLRLTSREQQTLSFIAAGYTADEIARALYISKETIDSHRKNIIKKLGVANVAAAVAYALIHKLIL